MEITCPLKYNQQKTQISKKQEEIKKERTLIKESENMQSSENFSLDKKDAVIPFEEKPAPNANTNADTNISKPKTQNASRKHFNPAAAYKHRS
jgi:hypothetical protein